MARENRLASKHSGSCRIFYHEKICTCGADSKKKEQKPPVPYNEFPPGF